MAHLLKKKSNQVRWGFRLHELAIILLNENKRNTLFDVDKDMLGVIAVDILPWI